MLLFSSFECNILLLLHVTGPASPFAPEKKIKVQMAKSVNPDRLQSESAWMSVTNAPGCH
jgi:hypothetical protein